MEFAATIWAAAVIGSCYVAAKKRRPIFEGFVFGLFFGPLGMLTIAGLPEGDPRGDYVSPLARWF